MGGVRGLDGEIETERDSQRLKVVKKRTGLRFRRETFTESNMFWSLVHKRFYRF